MTDVILEDDAVLVEGNLGIGTKIPAAPLHVEANAEILSSGGGAGYAFKDRTSTDQRWVWYADTANSQQGTTARLYNDANGDLLQIGPGSHVFAIGENAAYAFADRVNPDQCWTWRAFNGNALLCSGSPTDPGFGDAFLSISTSNIVFYGSSIALGGSSDYDDSSLTVLQLDDTGNLSFAFNNKLTVEAGYTEIVGDVLVQKDLTLKGKLIQSLPIVQQTRPLNIEEAHTVIQSLEPNVASSNSSERASFMPKLHDLIVSSQQEGGLDIVALLSALVRVVQAQGEEIAALKQSRA